MTNTRQNLITAALKRFYRDGFRNVGLDQVLADVGISKTAFYKHFECKEDLLLAAQEMQDRWFQTYLVETVRKYGGETPEGQLRALLDVVDQITSNEEFQGCFFVKVAMEFPLLHEPAHVACASHKQAVASILRDLAERAGAADPTGLARELGLIMEGAYVTRQITGDRMSIDVGRRVANTIIDAHLAKV